MTWETEQGRLRCIGVLCVTDARAGCCRYAHVPVGNLPADYKVFMCDVFFARALKKENFLLWVSPSALPDLGGKEEDDNRLMTDMADVHGVKINVPGVYPYVCVEVNIESLAVNTILQSAHVNDVEGGAGNSIALDSIGQTSLEDMMSGAVGGNLTSFDETAQCTPAFKVLKSLIHTWLQEVRVFCKGASMSEEFCLLCGGVGCAWDARCHPHIPVALSAVPLGTHVTRRVHWVLLYLRT